MRKLERFLFVWNIIVITVLLIAWGVKDPSVLNFVSILLLLPSFFYFWIRLSSPKNTDFPKWTMRLFLLIAFLISMIILGFYAFSSTKVNALKNELNNTQDKIAELKLDQNEFDKIREENLKLQEEIANLKDNLRQEKAENTSETITQDLTDVLAETFTIGTLTAKDSAEIDVLEKPLSGSKRVGTIVEEKVYTYISFEDGWYEIELENKLTGWVRAEDVSLNEN